MYIYLKKKKTNIKQKQYCNKFNKDLKMVRIKKKSLKKQVDPILYVTLTHTKDDSSRLYIVTLLV